MALQSLFARACNNLAPLVSQTRCWNRVALHHLAYKGLREKYPQLGSQMICNVIYSVCRAARLVYQHPQSPWSVSKSDPKSLPVIVFSDDTPVFFDRHTLSIKKGQISLFSLDGRMRFELGLSEEDELKFRQEKLREISLEKRKEGYFLKFVMTSNSNSEGVKTVQQESEMARQLDLPSYLVVHTQANLSSSNQNPQAQASESINSERLRA